MAFLESLLRPGVYQGVDGGSASWVSLFPYPGNHYTIDVRFDGSLAINPSIVLLAMRWPDSTGACALLRASISVSNTDVVSPAPTRVDPALLFCTRSHTSMAAIGTAINARPTNRLTAPTQRSEIRFFGFKTPVTPTWTADASPAGGVHMFGTGGAGAGTVSAGGALFSASPYRHPIVMDKDNGIIVQWGGSALESSGGALDITLEFTELSDF